MIEENTPDRTFVIADIHGDKAGLLNVLTHMFEDGMDLTKDTLIQLGDIIDGGSESSYCVSLLHELQQTHPTNVIVLLGNHEDLLLQAIGKNEFQSALRMWWYQGGEATWRSYRETNEQALWLIDYGPRIGFTPNPLMAQHIEWFKTLPLYHETEDFIFVHAGLRPMLPLKAQKRHDLLWLREEFYNHPYEWEKPIVYGHTAREAPLISKGKIGLDTKWHGAGYVGGAVFCGAELLKVYP